MKDYCDSCGCRVNDRGSHGAEYKVLADIVTPFKVNMSQGMVPRYDKISARFILCGTCDAKRRAAHSKMLQSFKSEWLRVLNEMGLGKPFAGVRDG